jgi:hypothetical protein
MKADAGSRLVEKMVTKMALNQGNLEHLFVPYGLTLFTSGAPLQLSPSFEESGTSETSTFWANGLERRHATPTFQ